MKTREFLIEKYKESNKGSRIVDMNSIEMAGYFIDRYGNDPIGAINTYKVLGMIPYTTGSRAEQVIRSMRGEGIVN